MAVIPEGVTAISELAFYGCRRVQEVVIPEWVTNVANHAFLQCENLTRLTISAGVKSVGMLALEKCDALECIVAPDRDPEIWLSNGLMIPAVVGYLTNSEQYQKPEIREAYDAYLLENVEAYTPKLFRQNLVQGLIWLADRGKITLENFEKDFLRPAQEAEATECVAFLLDWKQNGLPRNQLWEAFEI